MAVLVCIPTNSVGGFPFLHTLSSIYCLQIFGSQLWYIYTMEYYSAVKKNSFESVLMRWMKLEPIIQSEVSQKEKHQYSILTHIWNLGRWQ